MASQTLTVGSHTVRHVLIGDAPGVDARPFSLPSQAQAVGVG